MKREWTNHPLIPSFVSFLSIVGGIKGRRKTVFLFPVRSPLLPPSLQNNMPASLWAHQKKTIPSKQFHQDSRSTEDHWTIRRSLFPSPDAILVSLIFSFPLSFFSVDSKYESNETEGRQFDKESGKSAGRERRASIFQRVARPECLSDRSIDCFSWSFGQITNKWVSKRSTKESRMKENEWNWRSAWNETKWNESKALTDLAWPSRSLSVRLFVFCLLSPLRSSSADSFPLLLSCRHCVL